jgi:ERCC4-related helicase
MRDFYHHKKRELESVPHILGLTASPIMRSKVTELQSVFILPKWTPLIQRRTIEANLDSISITPRIHRQELLKYVHRPTIIKLSYLQYDTASYIYSSSVLQNLTSICYQASIVTDHPQLILAPEPSTSWGQKRISVKSENFCAEQLKRFQAKAQHIYEQLGPWAADYFIIESIKKFRKTVDNEKGIFAGWEIRTKVHLLHMLNKINITVPPSGDPPRVSDKLDRLISFLGENVHPDFSGLVFVQQRATVSVMSALLSVHPKTRNRFRCAPYVGLSNSANRKQGIGELLDPRAMCDTLDDFRSRRKNLIISTDVLEEGIDITACHMVICFDNIPNLKSFIQRRGRARQEKSTYAIMLASNESSAKLKGFEELEEEMLQTYQNELRLQEAVSALESIREDVTDEFRVESTE